MILYHGSKSGIKGDIAPKSRDACDFGQGFYMGDLPDQPKGLIAEFPDNRFYELDCDFAGLKIKTFEEDANDQIDWHCLLLITGDFWKKNIGIFVRNIGHIMKTMMLS